MKHLLSFIAGIMALAVYGILSDDGMRLYDHDKWRCTAWAMEGEEHHRIEMCTQVSRIIKQ